MGKVKKCTLYRTVRSNEKEVGNVMDKIYIEDLRVFGHHGVYEQEKNQGQTFLVNCEIETDFAEAAATDNLSNTVDYGTVCLYIKKYFAENRYDLLETVVEDLANKMMYAFPGIHKIYLKIMKPDAPIPMEFNAVGVSTTKEWTTVAISFGSNIEPRDKYITDALETLMVDPAIRNLVVSDYIETEPYGVTDQDKFLNGAATFDTLYEPEELLDELHKLENAAGRKRTRHWGPRTLDLDIVLFGNRVITTKKLTIPHIDMCNRTFVLDPLASIAPGLVHPVRRRTIYDLQQALQEKMKG